MALEIERKFLVKDSSFKAASFAQKTIQQGYLNSHKNRTVRIRIIDDKAFMTIKGKSNASGTTRFEWEKEMDLQEAKELLQLCEPSLIQKTRFYVKSDQHLFEIDEFFGENSGLVVAEIELENESDSYEKPLWLGKEVTGDEKYYNSQLSKFPFKDWE
jgi:adenylate cyclase